MNNKLHRWNDEDDKDAAAAALSAGHTVINGDQIYPAVQPYANFGQYDMFSCPIMLLPFFFS